MRLRSTKTTMIMFLPRDACPAYQQQISFLRIVEQLLIELDHSPD